MNPDNLPIFKKGREIFETVNQVARLIPEDNEHLQFIKGINMNIHSLYFIYGNGRIWNFKK
jgi:hypothetical protein